MTISCDECGATFEGKNTFGKYIKHMDDEHGPKSESSIGKPSLMKEKEKLLERVSILYREQRKQASDTEKNIEMIKIKLIDTSIPHSQYIELQNELIQLNQRYLEEIAFAEGIALAREELF